MISEPLRGCSLLSIETREDVAIAGSLANSAGFAFGEALSEILNALSSMVWFSQAIEAEEGDNEEEEEEEREREEAGPPAAALCVAASLLSVFDVRKSKKYTTRERKGHRRKLGSGSVGKERGRRERRRHLYLSLVKFRRRGEQEAGGRGR